MQRRDEDQLTQAIIALASQYGRFGAGTLGGIGVETPLPPIEHSPPVVI